MDSRTINKFTFSFLQLRKIMEWWFW